MNFSIVFYVSYVVQFFSPQVLFKTFIFAGMLYSKKTFLFLVTAVALTTVALTIKKKGFSPPGTVKISKKLFYDETEVTNVHWQAYTLWMKKNFGDSSVEYLKSLPDTTVWLDTAAYNLPYVNYYFQHQAYKDYPVVGISYEQAVSYCKWRTDRVKEIYKIRNKKRDFVPKDFQYRLPASGEWETVARAPYSEKTMKLLNKKYKGYSRYNFKRTIIQTSSAQHDNADVTAPVYAYWPNNFGTWQIFGNVAEIVSEKGIAKGGSWFHLEADATIEKDFIYNKPKIWLGFRCVCEVLE